MIPIMSTNGGIKIGYLHVLIAICETNAEGQQITSPVPCRELHVMIPSGSFMKTKRTSVIDRASTESQSSIGMMTAVFCCIGPGSLSTKLCIIVVTSKSCAVQKVRYC